MKMVKDVDFVNINDEIVFDDEAAAILKNIKSLILLASLAGNKLIIRPGRGSSKIGREVLSLAFKK